MKITLVGSNKKTQTIRTGELTSLMQAMQTEIKSRPVSALREELRYLSPDSQPEKADRLSAMIFAAAFRRKEGQISLVEYNAIVLLEINRLAGKEELDDVKRIAAQMPQTLATFTGSGGHSVKILVRFTRPDGTLPSNPEEAILYQAHAYIKAIRIYAPMIPFPIDFKEPLLERGCRYSFDPELYYAPNACAVIMEQPHKMPEEEEIPEVRLEEANPVNRMLPGYDKYRTASMLYETSLDKTWDTYGELKETNMKEYLTCLARNCFRSGVPEEDMLHWTLFHFDLEKYKEEVRATVRNCYKKESGFGSRPCISSSSLMAMKTNDFFNRRYQFRHNTVSQETEYRKNLSAIFRFQPVDERVMNTVALEAHEEGLELWDRDIKRYLHSSRIPDFHPFEQYLTHLPQWDGQDRIRKMAGLLSCRQTFWPDFFYRWFLGMVAQWMGKNKAYGNSSSPLLVSAQGLGKSTFCKRILPPELSNYYNDHIDFSRKRDAELYLHRFALINIDEFDQISEKDQAFLKHILQKPEVLTRKPYQSTVQTLKRHASFIATSNHKDLLTDLSGSRRFICIEVLKPINNSIFIDYGQLYAQAVKMVQQGERTYFNPDEQAMLAASNEEFRMVPPMEQLFNNYFTIPSDNTSGEWLMAIEIFDHIKKKSGIRLSDTKINHFGRILTKLGVPYRRTNKGGVYHVKESKNS